MHSKSSRIFIFLLLSFLLYFIQFSLCEVEFNDNRFSSSEPSSIKKREPSSLKENFKYGITLALGAVGLAIFAVFLILCYLLSFCVNRKAMNDVILSVPWTLLHFVLDAIFIKNQGKDVPSLYMPSLVFLIGPVVVNIILSLLIIIKENNKSAEFKRWFINNSSMAATATVLSGADMSILKLLYSRIFRLKRFNAPFSDEAKNMILWGCVINSIIEDIPRLVIQVLYKAEVDKDFYSLIPFLNLITVSVKLPIGIIGRAYEALKDHRNLEKQENDDDNNNEKNNGDDDVEK